MDWAPTEDQLLIRDMVREFVAAEIEPNAAEWDRNRSYPAQTVQQLGELGMFGMLVPEEWGGAGLDVVSYCLALEEIASGDAATCVAISVTNSVYCVPVHRFGTDEQRRRWLEPCARGEWLGAFCLSEPDAGSDATALRVRAVREGDDYVIDGTKAWVTSGSVCGAMLVFAVTDPDSERRRVSCFIVDPDMPGVTFVQDEEKMGLRSSRTDLIAFDGCRVPVGRRLGEQGQGMQIALSCLDGGRIGIGAQSVGIARSALAAASSYAADRIAFGGPIVALEAVQHKLARMRAEIDAARLLYLRAARLRDVGDPSTMAAAVAKLYGSEMCNRVCYEAVQIHGGYGYVIDYPVERYYRDARVTTIYEGTSEIQRLVIARSALASPAT